MQIGTAKVYRVGGYVRDHLLGKKSQDIDYVVVGATPELMIEHGFQKVGADFPVFLKDGEEYALARTEARRSEDVYDYHNFIADFNPEVTLEQDLARRDLTINSMAMDDDGNIIDPYGGQADLANKIFRHTTMAFQEDPVRILRVARFAARHPDFVVAPETVSLMKDMVTAGALDNVVPERLWKEVSRGLMEQSPIRMFDVLFSCGALFKFGEYLYTRHDPATKRYLAAPSQSDDIVVRYVMSSATFEYPKAANKYSVPNELVRMGTVFYKWFRKATDYRTLTPAEKLELLKGIGVVGSLRNSDVFIQFTRCLLVWIQHQLTYVPSEAMPECIVKILADQYKLINVDVETLITNVEKSFIPYVIEQHYLKLLG